MIKVIIFDFAGVLTYEGDIRNFTKKYAKNFHVTEMQFNDTIWKYWKPAKVNKISSKAFWEGIARDIGCDKNYLRSRIVKYMKINRGMLNLVKKLNKKYKTGLLSNQIEDWLEEKIKENKLNKLFDIILTSYGFGIAKPDERIFKEALKRLKVKPEEVVFIDDLEKNTSAAKKLGMVAILFTNQKTLEKQLKEIL